MIRLTATTEKLQAVLAGAVSATQPQAVVCYSDQTTTGYSGGKQLTALNSTTDVDILAAPAASTIRDVDFISVHNRDSASVTVTIKYDVSATDSIIIKVTLLTLETLEYTHGSGWKVIDADGRIKNSATGSPTGAAGGDLTGTYPNPTIADGAIALNELSDVVITSPATGATLVYDGANWIDGALDLADNDARTGTLPVANGGTGATTSTGTGSTVLSAGPTFTGTVTTAAITATGLVDLSGASAGQIKFPATQNPSADANTLDDYEEGTWTPGYAAGGASVGVTYSSQLGLYTKTGNVVAYSGLFALSAKGSSTGGITVTGLPFSTNGTAGYRASASPLGFDFAASYTTSMQVDLTNSSTSMRVFKFAAGNASQITDADVQNNSQMEINGLYHV